MKICDTTSLTTHIFSAFRIEEIAIPHVENKIVFHAMCDCPECVQVVCRDRGLCPCRVSLCQLCPLAGSTSSRLKRSNTSRSLWPASRGAYSSRANRQRSPRIYSPGVHTRPVAYPPA